MRMKSQLLGSLLAGLAVFPATAEYLEKPIETIMA